MPRDLRPLLLPAAFMLLLPAGPTFAGPDDAVRIGTATGVTFSGYSKDDEGRRQWTLSADTAAPLSAPGAGKNDRALERVRIVTFDKTGRPALTIAAPNARYRADAKTASDPGPVVADGEGVKLTGRDWRWVNGEDKTDTITIDSEVRVTVTPPGAAGAKAMPVVITANHLVARMTPAGGMHLAFEGEVRLTRDSAILTCGKLSTRVRGSGAGFAAKPGRDDVERIDAEGGVRLINKGTAITGRTAEVFPAKDLYSVNGDAEFRVFSDNRIRVNGEAMHYDRRSERIKVDPVAGAADGRVSAELPCLDEKRKNSKDPAQAALRARVSGRDMEILVGTQSNTLVLTGDVRLVDPDYIGSCERLTVEAPRTKGPAGDFPSAGTRDEAVKSFVAEDSVVLTREGRTLRCGRAEILPKESLAILTLSPRAEDPAQGAAFEATRMTIDTSDPLAQKLTGESAPGKPVKVTLPGFGKTGASARPGEAPAGSTFVEAGLLVATKRADTGVFEFEDAVKITGTGLDGSCDRLGVEIDTRPAAGKSDRDRHIRRVVAVGSVKLRQDAYAAEAGRAEIYPHAGLKELSVADDNGMDGREPFFVTLSRGDSGPRPKVTLPTVALPALGGLAPKEIQNPDTPPAGAMTVESDFQEFVQGAERLRAFARGDVRLIAKGVDGRAASSELLATAKAPKPGAKPVFSADTLVARGGVTVKFGEYNAKAATMEIFPAANRLVLSGSPSIDGMVATPGVERKVLEWTPEKGPDGKSNIRLHMTNEARAGFPSQIIRPQIRLPSESTPDLGRALKSLDKPE